VASVKILQNFDFNKNRLQNPLLHVLASAPSSPVEGQVYYDSVTHTAYYYTGSAWQSMQGGTITLTGDVTGTSAASVVSKLTTRTLSPAAPSDGNVLTWDNSNSQWEPGGLAATGPLSISYNGATTTFSISGASAAGPGTLSIAFFNDLTNAINTNTVSTLVKRDSNGDFAGRYITGTEFITTSGPMIKNNSGVLEVRNNGDSAYADLRVENLFIQGATTVINSETLSIADNTIVLNSNVSGASTAPTEDAGISISRGGSGSATLLWNETSNYWQVTDDLGTFQIARKYAAGFTFLTNGSSSFTHNLGTTDIHIQVFDNSGNLVLCDAQATSTTAATLSWGAIGSLTTGRVVIIG
jgi:hypothetical protein